MEAYITVIEESYLMRAYTVCTPHLILGDKIKESEMGWECNIHEKGDKYIQNFSWKIWRKEVKVKLSVCLTS
jgi:hypothetical protein